MINKKVVLGAIVVAGISLLYIFLLLNGISYRQQAETTPKAKITVIAAGAVPTVDMNYLQVTPTQTALPFIEVNGISIEKFVKIEGTGGVGLRIRRDPGMTTDVVFLANESEVFIVIGGPLEKDGMLWWQLSAPYDETRSGWASANYLVVLADENQQ